MVGIEVAVVDLMIVTDGTAGPRIEITRLTSQCKKSCSTKEHFLRSGASRRGRGVAVFNSRDWHRVVLWV
jgi:hypothetical protein